ncbi:sugar ABC transporter ATP-binding protein [Crateriforma conspicua]|uniref:Ribose import ATP-binding protein RbsA n=1 Tax=Crateriforma conspicua TaxID=2527996 RepID=A0A5C5Y0A8_9PLAN|nr:sugar ABC transporter ATP-binding protein [Crateriforma conspicua]TWT68269.1 Ribose import ATP-binding protein RbsA [Crateriforma conspicua]
MTVDDSSNRPSESTDDRAVVVAEGLGKRYGPHWVLRDVSIRLRPGQVMALLGENGAGKSTMIKILSGAVVPDEGSLSVSGAPIRFGRPDVARRSGIATVYQELSVCDDLSVEDNIMLGREHGRIGTLNRRSQRQIVDAALQRLGHADLDPKTQVGGLSVAAKQLVEIARAIAGNAKLLILDEPTSSLTAADVRQLFEVTRKLAGEGLAVLYISHFLEEVRQLCDSYTVLRDGRMTGSGQLSDAGESEIVRLMVGRDVDDLYPQTERCTGEPVLRCHNVTGPGIASPTDLTVHRGEILGIAGLIGAGRTELVEAVFGMRPRGGGVEMNDTTIPPDHPAAAIAAGLSLVSEDRKGQGLAQNLSIADNTTLSRLGPYATAGVLNEKRRHQAVDELIEQLQVKCRGGQQTVGELSGGNQQKVALARSLHEQADCLILDEPTRGVDVGTKAQIYRLIGRTAADGTAILFISSYFQELLHMCDRIAVMARGRIVEIRDAKDWDEHDLLIASMKT